MRNLVCPLVLVWAIDCLWANERILGYHCGLDMNKCQQYFWGFVAIIAIHPLNDKDNNDNQT